MKKRSIALTKSLRRRVGKASEAGAEFLKRKDGGCRLTMRFSDDLYTCLDQMAQDAGRSFNAQFNHELERALKSRIRVKPDVNLGPQIHLLLDKFLGIRPQTYPKQRRRRITRGA